MDSPSRLKEHLLKPLLNLPGSFGLTLHVLATTGRKHSGLYPHSSLPAKSQATVFQQHILVLLSMCPNDRPDGSVLVSAVEATLYVTPSSFSSILYISKVDSTGLHRQFTTSPTRDLVISFLEYFVAPPTRPTRRIRIQLFARAQTQYLFPNSSQLPEKKVLSDVRLCRWWKEVFSGVVAPLSATPENLPTESTHLFFLLPGFTKDEAEGMLRSSVNNTQWIYSHPYSLPYVQHYNAFHIVQDQSDLEFPPFDLFDVIPTFSDDPKARFLVELVATNKSEIRLGLNDRSKSPPRKKAKITHEQPKVEDISGEGLGIEGVDKGEKQSVELNNETRKERSLISVSPDEFWERMGYRQECSQSAVTGFFVADVETLALPNVVSRLASTYHSLAPQAGLVPPTLHARILTSLLNLDFGSISRAEESTKILTDSIRGLICGIQAEAEDRAVTAPLGDELMGSNASAEAPPRALGDDGANYVMSFVTIDNPTKGEPTGPTQVVQPTHTAVQQQINVLQPRKKKRPAS